MPAWAFKSVGDEREWQGNGGYEDIPGIQYVYTNTVGNYRQVGVGDTVVVHDRDLVHGVSIVDAIDVVPDVEETVRRCPSCGRTAVERRKHLLPVYRCNNCKSAFDQPLEVVENRTVYTAHIAANWQAIDGAMTTPTLMTARPNSDRQSSIRPLNPELLEQLLDGIGLPRTPTAGVATVNFTPAKPNGGAGSGTPITGGRRQVMTPVRNGQGRFRRELLQRDGLRCAITGECHPRALEAAHLKGFAEHETHVVEEGLLLRADVHRLFDAGLIAIDPKSSKAVVAPELLSYPTYRALHGQAAELDGVSMSVLAEHFATTTANWGL